jgi:hypothetical protein
MAVTRIKNNQITDSTVVASAKLVSGSVTGGLLSNPLNYSGDFTISGNLTVNGTTTTVDTTNTLVADPVIVLSRGETGTPSNDAGILIERGTSNNAAWLWDETNDRWMAITTTSDGQTGGSIAVTAYANIKANAIEVANIALGNIQITDNTISSTNTNGNINITPNGSGEVVASTLAVTDLTTDRVVYVGSNDSLTDNANLTFNGSTLVVTGTSNVTGQFNIDNIRIDGTVISTTANNDNISLTPNGTGEVIASTLAVTDLTTNRVIYVGANDALVDSSNLTFDGTTHTVTGTSNVSGQFNVDNIRIDGAVISTISNNDNVTVTPNGTGNLILSTATASRIFYAGTNKEVLTNSNLTFDGSTLVVTGTSNVSGQLNVDNIRIDGTTVSTISNNDNISLTPNGTGTVVASTLAVTDLTQNRVVYVNSSDKLIDSANLTFDGSTLVVTGTANVSGQFNADNVRIDGNTLSSINANGNITVSPDGTGNVIINTATASRIFYSGANKELLTTANLTFDGTNMVIAGDLGVNGGDITTTSSTATLFNANATTLNVGGAATTVNIGAATGTTIIKNDLQISGNDIKSSTGNVAIIMNNTDVTVVGNLTVQGVTTNIGTSDLIVQDSLINLHTTANLAPLVADDGRDVGIIFHYYKTSDKEAALVWGNDSGSLEYYSDATETVGGTISGTYGNIKAATFISNISTGTAPFTVNSTTEVANLNVQYANTVTGASQSNITSLGNLTIANIDNIQIDGNTISSTQGNILIDPTANIIIDNATANLVFYAGANKELLTNANLSFNGTTFVVTGTSNITGQFNIDNIRIDGTVISTLANNDNISLTPNGTGEVIASTLAVTDLTTNRVVYVGSNDALVDSSNLTFDGTTHTVTGTSNVSGQLNVDNIRIDGTVISTFANNDNITVTPNGTGNLIVNTATASRIFYAGSNKEVITNSNLTFDGSTHVVTGTSNVTGQFNVDNIRIDDNTISSLNTNGNINITPNGTGEVIASTLAVTDLTTNRVVYVGSNDALVDSSNLTFDGTTHIVTGTSNVTGQFNVDNIRIDDNTISSINTNGNINLSPNGTGYIIVNSGADSSDFIVNGNTTVSASYANIFYVKASTGQIGIGTNSPASNVLVDMDAFTTSVLLPKGTTGQRPSGDEVEGMLRYNTSNHYYEFWDGNSWESTTGNFTTIVADSFSGDATTLAFTLSQSATSASIIVSINGVVQIPGTAYGVSGTTLTFTEAPQVGDAIDVRLLTTTTTVTGISDLNTEIQVSDTSEVANVKINGNLILQVSNAAVYPGTNGTISLGKASTGRWSTVYATNTSIQNADLAECYLGDSHIPPATVVSFGGNEEVTICMEDMDTRVAGVVSTHPAHVMNSLIEGEHVIELALQGRVPCRVTGVVRKGDMMVSAGNGMARAEENPKMGSVIGKALEDFDGPEGIIEVVVGRV